MIRTGFVAVLALLLAGCAQRSPWTLPVLPIDAGELARMAPPGRLPGNARPVSYRAALEIDPHTDGISGHVEIDIRLEAAATGLWIHGDDLDVRSVTATAAGETVTATWTEVLDTGVVWVGFPRRLDASKVTLAVDYTAPYNTGLAGLFKVTAQGEPYVLAKSESIEARRFLPGFDEPGMKAVFDMTLTVPEGMRVVANTPEMSRRSVRPGFEEIHFAPTRALPTYLLSAAVGNFDRVGAGTLPPNGIRKTEIPLAGYARKGKGGEMDFVLSLTPPMVRILEETLRQPYPYDKLDLVAAPEWPSGATELAGAITYRESRILRGPNAGPSFVRQLMELHAHELSHSWFGNLVTPPWWDDLWLKESFAVWSETVVLSVLDPEGQHEVDSVADGITAMGLDSLASARAVAAPVIRNEDIRSAYDAITYSKGQAVIRMVDHYFKPERFRPALGRYIARYADGSADSAVFFDAIADSTGEKAIGEVFRDFVIQNGVPLISAELQCRPGGAKLTLSQQRYIPLGSALAPDRHWTVPVCTRWLDGANLGETCTLLTSATTVISLDGAICPSVIVPNANGAGYYRFTLPAEGWQALARALPRLPATEALASLDSAEAAFNAGTLGARDWFGVLEASFTHADAAVVSAALRAADSLLRQLALHPAASALREEIAEILDERIAASGEEIEARLLAFRALTLREPDARADLRRRLVPLLDGAGGLSSDYYVPALRAEFADGGLAGFERILTARTRLDDAVFTQAVADAIGSVTEPELAVRARTLMFDGTFGAAASQSIASSLMGDDLHREETWRALTSRFPEFLAVIPSQSRRATPRLARAFCDPGRTLQLDALFTQHAALAPGHEQALAETREYLKLCAVQAEAARQAFSDAL